MPEALHCEVAGEGPALVLLHPVGLDGTFWGPLVDEAARSRRVLCVDLRGHGRSAPARRPLSIEDYAADVHAAMVRHGTGAATVLGLSFGGMIATELALGWPAAVRELILCGCPAGIGPDLQPVVRERGLVAERDGMQAVVEPTIARWFTPDFVADRSVDAVKARLLADDPLSFSAAWHAIATFDSRSRLQQIRARTTVIAGEQDAATPMAASRILADGIHGANLMVLPSAPHMMQIERPAEFTQMVATVLAG